MKTDRNVVTEMGDPSDRHAKIIKTPQGYEVDIYNEGDVIRTIELHKHSESYAEDCAENWVLGIIKYENTKPRNKR